MTEHFEAELRRATESLDQDRRAELGQFMTPVSIADFMASLFRRWPKESRLLDPGAGIGSLTQSFAHQFFKRRPKGGQLYLTAYEVEMLLAVGLKKTIKELKKKAPDTVKINANVHQNDFLHKGTFSCEFNKRGFTHVILNPPYKKIGTNSKYRTLLRKVGVETGNLYTAFLAVAVALTAKGGEIVAIVPRSFCNGTYFRPFRKWLLEQAALKHIHVFESRRKAFHEDAVLQENIIIRLEKETSTGPVIVSTSHSRTFDDYEQRKVPFKDIVKPDDEERFIHIPTFEVGDTEGLFSCSLAELGLDVATGPVVDFRLRDHLLKEPATGAVPLLYAHHFAGGELRWPRQHKKPNAVVVNDKTDRWLMPKGWYTITKRFSSKEERRRIVAFVLNPDMLAFDKYGFENHLNVIHSKKAGVDPDLARGMALFLNSTLVDQHFRNFSGHTQVNATDLRTMRYPTKETLITLGKTAAIRGTMSQGEIDAVVEGVNGSERRAH